jgi:small subunit ribosomal protein S1
MDSGTTGTGSFAEEFENYSRSRFSQIRPGRVVSGKVVKVGKDIVAIDIGFKSDGIVPLEQFPSIEGKPQVKPGDVVDVYIIQLENELGQVLLSKERADQKRIWEDVENRYKDGGIISGVVVQKVKGGLQVDIGIPAFLPGSQIDVRPHRNLDKFIGETFECKVLKITRDKGNIVLSRRAVMLAERDHLRGETLKVLSEGVVMEGVVKNVTDYGAFVDLGGIDGLLHITDISWGRINHPSEKLTVGQIVPVVVLKYDHEKERVSLGMKQLKPDPWATVHERYPTGGRAKGKVTNLTDYGAFVELEEGIEGLIHVSEMSWTKQVRHPSKILNEGDFVEAAILGFDSEQRRISLGLKQLTQNPWEDLLNRHPIGSKIKGKIRSIVDFGVFVEVEEGIDGLVHASDISWTRGTFEPKEIHDMYKKGDELEAVVLNLDSENRRLSLGIKQLSSDPWDAIPQRYPLGSKVKGTIRSFSDFGIFVEIEPGVEGLVHSSHAGVEKGKALNEAYEIGSVIETEVVKVDREKRKIGLSISALKDREHGHGGGDDEGAITFGDLIRFKTEERSE